jgi:cell division protein FtsB
MNGLAAEIDQLRQQEKKLTEDHTRLEQQQEVMEMEVDKLNEQIKNIT